MNKQTRQVLWEDIKRYASLVMIATLSVLYLLKIEFSKVTVGDWIALAIIAVTLIPMIIGVIRSILAKRRKHLEDRVRRELEEARRKSEARELANVKAAAQVEKTQAEKPQAVKPQAE